MEPEEINRRAAAALRRALDAVQPGPDLPANFRSALAAEVDTYDDGKAVLEAAIDALYSISYSSSELKEEDGMERLRRSVAKAIGMLGE
jgi:hypothetical protein